MSNPSPCNSLTSNPAENDAAQFPAAKRILHLLISEKHFRRDVEPMTQTLDMFSIQFPLAAQDF